MKFPFFLVIASTLTCVAHGDAGSVTRFNPATAASTGWVVQQPSGGGQYVFGAEPEDGNPGPTFPLGRIPRQAYDYFSAEEQEALSRVKDERIKSEVRETRQQARAAMIAKTSKFSRVPANLKWPRVMIQDNGDICVPTLAFSDDNDWREHLVCWSANHAE